MHQGIQELQGHRVLVESQVLQVQKDYQVWEDLMDFKDQEEIKERLVGQVQ